MEEDGGQERGSMEEDVCSGRRPRLDQISSSPHGIFFSRGVRDGSSGEQILGCRRATARIARLSSDVSMHLRSRHDEGLQLSCSRMVRALSARAMERKASSVSMERNKVEALGTAFGCDACEEGAGLPMWACGRVGEVVVCVLFRFTEVKAKIYLGIL